MDKLTVFRLDKRDLLSLSCHRCFNHRVIACHRNIVFSPSFNRLPGVMRSDTFSPTMNESITMCFVRGYTYRPILGRRFITDRLLFNPVFGKATGGAF